MKKIEALLAKKREGVYVKGPDVSEYKVAILCALRDEIVAICSFLEEKYDPESIDVEERDFNRYKLGKLAGRYVVVVQMPETGKSSAAATATHLGRTFQQIKLLLMVGIGGGIPVREDRIHVHVGDVVVSRSSGKFGAVFEHDKGKAHSGGRFEPTSHLNKPPQFAISIANDLDEELSKIPDLLDEMIKIGLENLIEEDKPRFRRPSKSLDRLYKSSFPHPVKGKSCTEVCDEAHVESWHHRDREVARAHLGLISSGDLVVKDEAKRDKLAALGVRCVEMEAAGLMDTLPSFIIRGISDYADSHKFAKNEWHGFASMSAAAYAYLFIKRLRPTDTKTAMTLKEILDGVHELNDDFKRAQIKAKTEEILNRSSTTNMTKMERVHQHLADQSTKGTGTWFLKHPKYIDWKENEHKLLYCSGVPGTGKSVLTASVIDDLRETITKKDQQFGFAFFYCRRLQGHDFEGSIAFLSCMLSQFIQNVKRPLDCIIDPESLRTASTQRLKDILIRVIKGFQRSFIIVDALDEWHDDAYTRSEFIEMLLELRQQTECSVFVTSRNLSSITELLEKEPRMDCIKVSANHSDMRAYLSKKLERCPTLREKPTASQGDKNTESVSLLNECIETLIQHSNEMFLLTRLRAEKLLLMASRYEIKQSLNKVKAGLDGSTSLTDAYEDIVKRIRETGYWDSIQRLCQWVMYARRPMTLTEIRHGLRVTSDDTDFDREKHIDEEILLSNNAGLLEMTKDGFISFVHVTAQTYLEEKGLVSKLIADASLAISCVTYIAFRTFEIGPSENWDSFNSKKESYALYVYASRYWGPHAAAFSFNYKGLCEEEKRNHSKNYEDLKHVLKRFLLQTKSVRASIQAYQLSKRPVANSLIEGENGGLKGHPAFYKPRKALGIHLAAIYGLEDMVMFLRKAGAQSLSISDDQGHTPLLHAAWRGHQKLAIQIIPCITKNQLNKRNSRGETPLIVASIQGHVSVVKLLLDTDGVKIGAKDKKKKTALAWAAQNGHKDVVAQLFQKSGSTIINEVDSDGLTPLARASAQGHMEMVSFLLEATLKDPTRSSFARSLNYALLKASQNGRFEIVEMLLDRAKTAINANWRHTNGHHSALWLATKNRHRDIIKLLVIKGGADCKLEDNRRVSPLLLAWQSGDEDLVSFFLANGLPKSDRWPFLQFLLQRDPHNKKIAESVFQNVELDLNMRSGGETPVTWALENDMKSSMKLVLDQEVDINAVDDRWCSPLLIATLKGDEHMVGTILQRSEVDMNMRSKEGLTPLLAALHNGNKSIAQILLHSNKADAAVVDDVGRTSLHVAASKGFFDIVDLLLQNKEVDINAIDLNGNTPLFLAIDGGYRRVVCRLIDTDGLDFRLRNRSGRSALLQVIEKGRKDIAEDLCKKSDELLDMKSPGGRNALFIALDQGRNDIVKMLLQISKESDKLLDSRDSWNRNVLHAAVERGRRASLSLLLDRCREQCFSECDANGDIPLHLAVKNKRKDLVEMLIKEGKARASLLRKDKEGLTPFCLAVAQRDYQITKVIHDHLVRTDDTKAANMRDARRQTPLARAISTKCRTIIQLLSKSPIIEKAPRDRRGRRR
ncbi:unnamed protein product [Clonostachys chloroleuca]|uniref:Uncharacterized protein n=1 Tax=Clonostachys chloroleuca TaxID=1926264 RepID=A0AA35MIS6_9HYPO|nr:unnamed protein product [Clonostachys chloroleuca]